VPGVIEECDIGSGKLVAECLDRLVEGGLVEVERARLPTSVKPVFRNVSAISTASFRGLLSEATL